MTTLSDAFEAQRRREFLRSWRAEVERILGPGADHKELHEMDCRECANEEYGAVVSANDARGNDLAQSYAASPVGLSVEALRNVGVHVPMSAIPPSIPFDERLP